MSKLLKPFEVDELLRYPRGRSARLARQGKLNCVTLPDGEIRFAEDYIRGLVGLADVAPAQIGQLPTEMVTAGAV